MAGAYSMQQRMAQASARQNLARQGAAAQQGPVNYSGTGTGSPAAQKQPVGANAPTNTPASAIRGTVPPPGSPPAGPVSPFGSGATRPPIGPSGTGASGALPPPPQSAPPLKPGAPQPMPMQAANRAFNARMSGSGNAYQTTPPPNPLLVGNAQQGPPAGNKDIGTPVNGPATNYVPTVAEQQAKSPAAGPAGLIPNTPQVGPNAPRNDAASAFLAGQQSSGPTMQQRQPQSSGYSVLGQPTQAGGAGSQDDATVQKMKEQEQQQQAAGPGASPNPSPPVGNSQYSITGAGGNTTTDANANGTGRAVAGGSTDTSQSTDSSQWKADEDKYYAGLSPLQKIQYDAGLLQTHDGTSASDHGTSGSGGTGLKDAFGDRNGTSASYGLPTPPTPGNGPGGPNISGDGQGGVNGMLNDLGSAAGGALGSAASGMADAFNKQGRQGMEDWYNNFSDLDQNNKLASSLMDPGFQDQAEAAARAGMHTDIDAETDRNLRMQANNAAAGGRMGGGGTQAAYDSANKAMASGDRQMMQDAFARKLQAGQLGSQISSDRAKQIYDILGDNRVKPAEAAAIMAQLFGDVLGGTGNAAAGIIGGSK